MNYIKQPFLSVHLESREERLFQTKAEASRVLGINQTSICRVLSGIQKTAGEYTFYYWNHRRRGRLPQRYAYGRKSIVATRMVDGKRFIFASITDASIALNLQRTSISKALQSRNSALGGYLFTVR